VSRSSESEEVEESVVKDGIIMYNINCQAACLYCNMFIPESKADLHIKECKERPYCNKCKAYLVNKNQLSEHLKMHGKKFMDKRNKFCHICNKMYSRHFRFVIHYNNAHNPYFNRKKFTCDICGLEMVYGSLLKHMRRHLNDYNAICKYCGQAFTSKAYLEIHERKHTNICPFKCTICEKAFRCQSTLNTHIKTHKKERNLECDVCHQMYANRVVLREHRQRHFEENRKHKCSTCEKAFFKPSELKMHITVHHNNEKPCICSVCNATFKTQKRLNLHAMKHTGIRSHICEKCGKSYVHKLHLRKHQEKHWDFECNICKKRFLTETSLNDHRQTNHIQYEVIQYPL
jgi:hypothetical protein